MLDALRGPWPWYVVGPFVGSMVPLLLICGNRVFGVSSSLRHLCAAVIPADIRFFKYDWPREGAWNLAFVAGILTGSVISARLIGVPVPGISEPTRTALATLGIHDISGLVPATLISWDTLMTWRGALVIIGSVLLVTPGVPLSVMLTLGYAR